MVEYVFFLLATASFRQSPSKKLTYSCVVTGCSSGIGKALATLIASKPSHRLIATARKPADLSYLSDDNPNILKLALDVTSPTSVNDAFESAVEHFGKGFHLDAVVNNAGYSLSGDTESATEEETHLEMETLFFGTARVSTRAIGVMRQHPEHRGGVIFDISSLAGQVGLPGHAYYHASKWAVEGWSESVAREMHPDWNSEPNNPVIHVRYSITGLISEHSQHLYRGACWSQD